MSGASFGADTHDIDRDLSLARYRGDEAEVMRLELERDAARAACAAHGHKCNPEGREACVWCGGVLQAAASRPGLVKVSCIGAVPKRRAS